MTEGAIDPDGIRAAVVSQLAAEGLVRGAGKNSKNKKLPAWRDGSDGSAAARSTPGASAYALWLELRRVGRYAVTAYCETCKFYKRHP